MVVRRSEKSLIKKTIYNIKVYIILSVGLLNKDSIGILPVSLGNFMSDDLAIDYNFKGRYKLKSSSTPRCL